MKRIISIILICAVCLCLLSGSAMAAGGTFIMDDQANLLTEAERQQLQSDYAALTEYVNTAFVTANSVSGSTAAFAESYVKRNFDSSAAIIFVIDMDNRQIYVYANHSGLSYVSSADSRAITDNIYKYASKGDYYACADAAFSQIFTKCQGGKIARPVKHITNALIAVVAGILLNFILAVRTRSRQQKKTVTSAELRNMALLPDLALDAPILIKSERHYNSSDSGSSGGGSGGGGGGGGGGGHSF